jgi:hypothetical protein
MSCARTATAAAFALTCGIAQGFFPVVRCAVSEPIALHIFLNGKARMAARDSIEGAVRRLRKPECQRVFADFMDPAGHRLAANLEGLGKTPVEYLTGLYFVEGDGSHQCRTDQTMAAFTAPQNKVIYLCGERFADRFARQTTGGEILIIHELLHSLGLGENPPTSAQITDRVRARCGD